MKDVKIIFILLFYVDIIIAEIPSREKPINIKVVPAKFNKLTLDDLDIIKSEVFKDLNPELKNLEEEMAENLRLKQKTMDSYNLQVNK